MGRRGDGEVEGWRGGGVEGWRGGGVEGWRGGGVEGWRGREERRGEAGRRWGTLITCIISNYSQS